MKLARVSLCSAFLAIYFSCQAHAQWTGTYEYKEKDFSGKMIVTDVSLCELEKSLGCLAAVRLLVINLSTKGKIGGGTCAIKSTGESIGTHSSRRPGTLRGRIRNRGASLGGGIQIPNQ
jgi:hypothetical protein